MAKFVEIQSCYRGHIGYELVNIDDISRIVLGSNTLFLRNPCNSPHRELSITQKSVDKLLNILDIVGEVEE